MNIKQIFDSEKIRKMRNLGNVVSSGSPLCYEQMSDAMSMSSAQVSGQHLKRTYGNKICFALNERTRKIV